MDKNVYSIIFGNLAVKDVLECRLVCKKWKSAIGDIKKFKQLCVVCPVMYNAKVSKTCEYHCDFHQYDCDHPTSSCKFTDNLHCNVEKCYNNMFVYELCETCSVEITCRNRMVECSCERVYCLNCALYRH